MAFQNRGNLKFLISLLSQTYDHIFVDIIPQFDRLQVVYPTRNNWQAFFNIVDRQSTFLTSKNYYYEWSSLSDSSHIAYRLAVRRVCIQCWRLDPRIDRIGSDITDPWYYQESLTGMFRGRVLHAGPQPVV
jgi:hypothetical protein